METRETKNLSLSANVVHKTVQQGISRRGKNENVYELSKI